jgi:two-component system, LytTR family, sensor histidine kinase AlgZ
MKPPALTDPFGFEFTGSERPPFGRVLLRTLMINELIALPVALVMAGVDGGFVGKLQVASIYSQTIGLTCAVVSWVTFAWLGTIPQGARRWVVVAQFFACGAVGAEIARRICGMIFPVIFGGDFNSGPAYVSWAIGATIALIVGFVLVTVHHLRARVLSTELEALQARINPHFLFNTLNSIAALIREDPLRAEAMTLRLSSLFRYTLEAPRRGLVTIEEEIVIVEGYLAIEQERLGDRLSYAMEIDDALLTVRVPPLTLQPLAENAIKHGIAASVAGGTVSVRGWQEGRTVHITVRNTGDGAAGSGGTGEGMENVRRRLRARFGRNAGVTLRRQDGATEAHLTFPVHGEP